MSAPPTHAFKVGDHVLQQVRSAKVWPKPGKVREWPTGRCVLCDEEIPNSLSLSVSSCDACVQAGRHFGQSMESQVDDNQDDDDAMGEECDDDSDAVEEHVSVSLISKAPKPAYSPWILTIQKPVDLTSQLECYQSGDVEVKLFDDLKEAYTWGAIEVTGILNDYLKTFKMQKSSILSSDRNFFHTVNDPLYPDMSYLQLRDQCGMPLHFELKVMLNDRYNRDKHGRIRYRINLKQQHVHVDKGHMVRQLRIACCGEPDCYHKK